MTTTHQDLWRSAAAAFDQRHALITEADNTRATPCDDFDIAALVRHAVDTQISIGALLGVDTAEGASWEPTRAVFGEALSNEDLLEGDVEHPGLGLTSKRRLMEIATHDMVIHTWDLSRALGVDDTLPAVNIQPALDSVMAFPEAVREALFAGPVSTGDDDDPQTRMLAAAGRSR